MFTGIVKYLGVVEEIEKKKYGLTLKISCNPLLDYPLGGSVMVNGACLTLVNVENEFLIFDVIEETLCKTNLDNLVVGAVLNLESSLTLNTFIDGHLVSGHVDFVAEVLEINDQNEYFFSLPTDFTRFLALKGSVAVNGVSLTVSGLDDDKFKVSLIPATLEQTNLQYLKVSDKVNIEIDLVARYLDRLSKNN